MLQKVLLTSLISVALNAEIHFQDIASKPSGRAKNFMVWQYLQQNISAKEADKAYALVEGNIYKIKKEYLKKSKNKTLLREKECKSMRDLLSIQEPSCFKMALSPYKTLNLNASEREKLLEKLSTDDINNEPIKNLIRIQAEEYKESAYILYSPETILSMFLSTTKKHRRGKLNLELSEVFMEHMFAPTASKWKKFALIKRILSDSKLHKLQNALLLLQPSYVNDDANFLLGLEHLKNNDPQRAIKHFQQARKIATKRINKDKNSFWIYLASQKRENLKVLLQSTDINMYTLYAFDILGIEPQNYFYTLPTQETTSTENISDPFVWEATLQRIQKAPQNTLAQLTEQYKQKEMLGVQSFIVEKTYNFKKHSFVMPYNEYLEGTSIDEKALIYALMKQESNFIPSALSRSFALGLMQIMPFVTDDLSSRMQNPIASYNDMFTPSYNIRYARKHLQWLSKSFYHPLFTAYAYNGGAGYLRRHLQSGTFATGKYEPFLSMESMQNRESREYGKRVLSNYVMYKKILGEKVSIVALLSTLTNPKKTDRYR